MRFRKIAILVTIAAAALRCSADPPGGEPGQPARNPTSAVVIHGIDHSATPSGAEVVLHANHPFSYTSYQLDSRTLVVELLDVHVEGIAEEVRIGRPQVERVRVSSVEGLGGGSIVKFEFENVLAAHHAIRLDGHDLFVAFPTLSAADTVAEPRLMAEGLEAPVAPAQSPVVEMAVAPESGATPADAAPAPAGSNLPPIPSAAAQAAAAAGASKAAPVETANVIPGPTRAGKRAGTLLAIEVRGGAEPNLVLKTDGTVAQEHFQLKNPPRLVIDLVGVIDKTATRSIPVSSDVLTRVRVAQFATRPRAVARVVLDLASPKPCAVVPTDEGLVVDFSAKAVRLAESGSAALMQVVQPLVAEAPAAPQPAATAPQKTAAAEKPAPRGPRTPRRVLLGEAADDW